MKVRMNEWMNNNITRFSSDEGEIKVKGSK